MSKQQQTHLPWLKQGRQESLSQEGKFQSWSEWTHFSLVTWTCRWGPRRPISETHTRLNVMSLIQIISLKKKNSTACTAICSALYLQWFTLMVSSEIASCLYCVPYHSSALSVRPSNDFETKTTLERENTFRTVSLKAIQYCSQISRKVVEYIHEYCHYICLNVLLRRLCSNSYCIKGTITMTKNACQWRFAVDVGVKIMDHS